jgi:hypothetical protein
MRRPLAGEETPQEIGAAIDKPLRLKGVVPDRAVCPRCHSGRLILQFDHVATLFDAKTRCKRIRLMVADCNEYRSSAPDCVTDAQEEIGGTSLNFLHRAWLEREATVLHGGCLSSHEAHSDQNAYYSGDALHSTSPLAHTLQMTRDRRENYHFAGVRKTPAGAGPEINV